MPRQYAPEEDQVEIPSSFKRWTYGGTIAMLALAAAVRFGPEIQDAIEPMFPDAIASSSTPEQ